MFVTWFGFADFRHGKACQLLIGLSHSLAHVLAAFSIFLLLEVTVQMTIEDDLAGQGYDSFFESFQAYEQKALQTEIFSSGILRGIIQAVFRIFDMPENMASTRIALCAAKNSSTWPPMPSNLTRTDLLTYYTGNFLYLFIISADVGAFIFGLYLYVCSTVDLHWNEAYSAIRDPNYKSFIRFKIDRTGDLHAFVIGIDKVPGRDKCLAGNMMRLICGGYVLERWKQDHRWESTKERQTRSRILRGKWPTR